MFKNFCKYIILKLIQLIEFFEYKNTNLDEKILNSILLNNIKIETDTGYKPVSSIHITKPFEIYDLYLSSLSENEIEEIYNKYSSFNKEIYIPIYQKKTPDLSCADTHIVFDKDMNEVFVKDLKCGDLIQTKTGLREVIEVKKQSTKVSMFDVTVEDENHRFYSNDILSHNTIISAIYIAWFAIFNYDKNIFLIANVQKTSKEIMDKVKVIFENLPFFIKPGIIKNDVMEMKFDSGSRIVSGTTTKRSGISFTIHLLYMDEFAHVADNLQKEFYYNIYPTISASPNSKIIITSTPNGYNLFYDIYTSAQKGESEYKAYEINWWEVPGRDDQWYKNQIANLGSEEAFNVQYGNSFLTADSRLMSPRHIERMEKAKVKYISQDYPDLMDLNVDYEKYMTFKPNYDIEKFKDQNCFFVFSIDIAEGGGGDSDSSVIDIFEVDVIDFEYFDEITSPTSFMDYFGLKQVAKFKCNVLSIEDFAKVCYVLLFNVYYSENVKIILEYNTYGGEFLKTIQNVFSGKNDFDEELVVKFLHKADAKIARAGLKIKPDNKPIIAQKFKKLYHIGRIEISDDETVDEFKMFGKNRRGLYEGLGGHDDLVMTSINVCEFFRTMDFADFVEEKFDLIDNEIKNEINKRLEKAASVEGDESQYDIYSIIDKRSNVEVEIDKLEKRSDKRLKNNELITHRSTMNTNFDFF